MKATSDSTADISIFGDIVGDKWSDSETSAKSFRDALKDLGPRSELNVHINSDGGSVFDGVAIGNMLKQNSAKVNVYIDGLAASIASVIAMSGDTIFMPSNAMMMIHMPWSGCMGNAKEMRKMADTLDTIADSSIVTYLEKAGDKLDRETLVQMMDEETWLTADEAVQYGLADEVLDGVEVAASISDEFKERYVNIPDFLLKKKDDEADPDDPDKDPDDGDDQDPDKKKPAKASTKEPKKKDPDDPDSNKDDPDDPDKDDPDSNDDDPDKKKKTTKTTKSDQKLLADSVRIKQQLEDIYNA